MRIGSFDFKPGLWPSVAMLVIFPILCGLGLWQLDRAAAKSERLDAYAQRQQSGPVDVDARGAFDATPGYRQARLTGRYDVRHQFLLDNQVQDSKVGYHVFTPLLFDGGRQAILVNRGWVEQGDSRQSLPALPTPDGEVTIAGVLSPAPGHGVLLGEDIEADKIWPRVVQAIVLPRLRNELDTELAPQVFLLDPNAAGGFVREWKIVQFGPERNLGYAFQWFMMAAAVLVIFIVVNTRRITRASEE